MTIIITKQGKLNDLIPIYAGKCYVCKTEIECNESDIKSGSGQDKDVHWVEECPFCKQDAVYVKFTRFEQAPKSRTI